MIHEFTHAIAPFLWTGVVAMALYLRHRRKMAEINAGPPAQPQWSAPQTSAQDQELARLRERVRVLERIATEAERPGSPQSLAAQIDALRD
ncbi:MAG: hypothetical protein KGJ57_14020 [Sphingomonadales bacterium]|nr:hypothetical protein [Sphingomonadales bacterium]MDE2170521.1 hypothetical protein [Sphingomonadales bacterium]